MFSESALQTEGFSWESMLSLALASKYSYRSEDDLSAIVKVDWDVEITAFADVGSAQGYVLESDQVAVVVYRGTAGISDWITNFKILSAKTLLGDAHLGFVESYRNTADVIMPRLKAAHLAGKSIWLCGHSLGGAIATVAAIETSAVLGIAGLATFGQPRTTRRSAANLINAKIGSRYFRFVNDDDVVPRIPKIFGHTGQLLHFDRYGDLKDEFSEIEEEGRQIEAVPALTDEQLAALQNEIRDIEYSLKADGAAEGLSESEFDTQLDETVEGLIPSVGDHAIDNYISAISRYSGKNSSNAVTEIESIASMYLAPHIGSRTEANTESYDLDSDEGLASMPQVELGGASAVKIHSEYFPLMLEVLSTEWTPPKGLKIQSRVHRLVTAWATVDQMAQLGKDPAVTVVESSRDAGLLELDESVPFVGGDAVTAPEVGEKGDSAIVGVIDTGIDILHNVFMDESGTSTRIVGIWDQRNDDGPTPHAIDPSAFSQDYGTLYLANELNSKIAQYKEKGEAVPPSLRDTRLHGTHVASIAAGRKTKNVAAGMAPEASILFVIPNLSQELGSPRSIGYSNSHVDALAFLTAAAAGKNAVIEQRMPIAINVSLGMNAGAHDGSTLLEAAFDASTGMGRDPGVVIVKSAGNERGHKGHSSVLVPPGGVATIEWGSSNEFRREDYFEAWFGEQDDLSFTLVAPSGKKSSEITFDNWNVNDVLSGNACGMTLTKGYRDNGANRFALRITPQASQILEGRWRLEIVGRRVGAIDQGRVNMWVERTGARSVEFVVEDEGMTLSVPGTAKTVITVGASNSETPWRLNESSSYGPTRTNGLKPDICAPGFQIEAARAATQSGDDKMAMSGTSMAAPHVTGALALVLSYYAKAPGARMPNAVQLGADLRRTVKGGTTTFNPGSGFGVMDAEAFFNELKNRAN